MKRSFCVLVLLLLTSAVTRAGPHREEVLTLFEHRRVAIAVPEGFTYESATDASGLPAVQLAAKEKISASLIFGPDPERELGTTRARAEKMVEAFQNYVEGSVEKAMQFEELESKTGAGTFCVFTDAKLVGQKEFPPGEYLHVTTGLKVWPGVVVIFRIFCNDLESPEYQAVMKMLRDSVQERMVPLK